MRPETRCLHLRTLSAFNTEMFRSLLYPRHVVSRNAKTTDFNGEINKPVTGYYLIKDRVKYFISKKALDSLPIRVTTFDALTDGKDSVHYVLSANSFRIRSERAWSYRELINILSCFNHTQPDQWVLWWNISMAGLIERTYICCASEPSFGKDSAKKILNALTGKVAVYKPRSAAGVLNQISTDGEIAFNEIGNLKSDIKAVVEDMFLQLGDGSIHYINGALGSTAHGTREMYETPLLSITAMYNRVQDYNEPEKRYFENLFSDKSAVMDRLLRIKLNGRLKENFTVDFDPELYVPQLKDFYRKIMRTIEWYRHNYRTELNDTYTFSLPKTILSDRQRASYDRIIEFLNLYAKDQNEFTYLTGKFNDSIDDYQEMISTLDCTLKNIVTDEEEVIE